MFRIEIKDVTLNNVSAQVWDSILRNGNAHLGFPNIALPAISYEFSAIPQQKISPDSGVLTRELLNTLEGIYIARLIGPQIIQELIDKVDSAFASICDAQPSQAIAEMVSFEKKIKQHSQGVAFNSADISFILAQSNALLMDIIAIEKPTFSSPPFVLSLSGGYRTWYVNQRLNCPTPNGSEESPFPSIAAALEEAQNQGLWGVNLFVYGGVYREPLEITRDTVIAAMPDELPVITESIVNNSSSLLSISGFHLVGADSPGAIWVNNSTARTILNDVLIDLADDSCIYQNGGEIRLEHVRVSRAHASYTAVWSGSGIMLTGGVQASLDNVLSENNESHGILINGAGTYASGNLITIQRNHFNRAWEGELVSLTLTGGTGALEVRNNAQAVFSNIYVRNNEIDGVLVHNNATVTLNDAVIERTRNFIPTGGWPDINMGGGIGVRARTGGHLHMTNFSISNCDLAGVVVGQDGEIDLSSGRVYGHPIGVHIVPGYYYDIYRLMDDVIYYDNERNLDATYLPIPHT